MISNQKSLPLAKALDGFIAREPAYFCIPGHRFERGVPYELLCRFGEGVFKYDLTEANGLDDLHDAKEAILKAQRLAAQLYGSDRAWFLVNGTTCGLEALMLAVSGEKDEIIAARNVHQSTVSGMVLSGARPVWVLPKADDEFGFCTAVSSYELKKAIEKAPSAKAVFIVSPTYYGACSDIEALADICHENGMPLIVDEAHGAHLYFNENFPDGALKKGADAVVMSTHKTAGSMTQSSLLHIKGGLIDEERLEAALHMTMSSSPSYVLMTSLDVARHELAMNGNEIMQRAFELSMTLRRGLLGISGISVFGGCDTHVLKERLLDVSRVVFSAAGLGIGGYELSDMLFERYSIALEMADAVCCTAVVTGANLADDIARLIEAVRSIAAEHIYVRVDEKEAAASFFCAAGCHIPKTMLTPREAFFAKSKETPLAASLGEISAETIAPYPPGIPIVTAGELIDEEVLEVLTYCRDNGIRTHSGHGIVSEKIKVIK